MAHHTKDKGDAGLGFVIADLMSNNIQVAFPISEHLPFDYIAISADGQLSQVSVKFRQARNGRVHVSARSCWADRHGTHVRHHAKNDYDAIAIYCPDVRKCYYARVEEIGKSLTLRLESAKNNQKAKIKEAALFESAARLFNCP